MPSTSLHWKPLVGKYLVAAKYAFVRWVNDAEIHGQPGSLAELRKHFLELARQTDVKLIPSYGVPSAADILGSAEDVTKALSKLSDKDKAAFISDQGRADFDLTINWSGLNLASLAVRETITMPPSPMILAVRRPDYLGQTQWEFRHGKRTIRAKLIDADWLADFQNRNVDVRPRRRPAMNGHSRGGLWLRQRTHLRDIRCHKGRCRSGEPISPERIVRP